MIINNNLPSINSGRVLGIRDRSSASSMEKLSSGMRINRAGDDASGLAVSEKMRAQVEGLGRASANARDGISFIRTTEGYLDEMGKVLQRIRVISIQASNGIYSSEDRMLMQIEVSQLIDEVDRIASHAQFNKMNILTGRFAFDKGENFPAASMWFHLGANMDQRERVYIGTMTTQGLGLRSVGNATFISVSSQGKANSVIGMIDMALTKIVKQRADLGSYNLRLEHTIKSLDVGYENLQAAESQIRDTDMAKEISKFVKEQVLSQTATAMLAKANARSQMVLSLLQQ